MRVTSEMMVTNTVRRLSTRLSGYERIQSQLATGKRILAPSDDPGGTGRALSLRATQRSREQEARNAVDARNWLDLTDSQLQSGAQRVQRVRDLAIRGANSLGATEREAIAREIEAVQEELVGIANTTHRGRPLFSGYGADAPVVREGGVWTYQGDDGAVVRRVGQQDLVRVNITASEAFGFGSPDGDVFTMLDELAAALRNGDLEAVSTSVQRTDDALSRIGDAQAMVGAHTNWVESALSRTNDALLALRSQLAEIEDVDMAEAVMELQTQEVAYEATLAALARALPPTLATFLR